MLFYDILSIILNIWYRIDTEYDPPGNSNFSLNLLLLCNLLVYSTYSKYYDLIMQHIYHSSLNLIFLRDQALTFVNIAPNSLFSELINIAFNCCMSILNSLYCHILFCYFFCLEEKLRLCQIIRCFTHFDFCKCYW